MVKTLDAMTVCNDCGNEQPGHYGDCPACGSTDVIVHDYS